MIPTVLFLPQQVATIPVRRVDMAGIRNVFALLADGFTPNVVIGR